MSKKRTFLVDGYQATAKPAQWTSLRGTQASGDKGDAVASRPPSRLPRATSAVSKPKAS